MPLERVSKKQTDKQASTKATGAPDAKAPSIFEMDEIQRAIAEPSTDSLTPSVINRLQRSHGNAFVNGLVQRSRTQPRQAANYQGHYRTPGRNGARHIQMRRQRSSPAVKNASRFVNRLHIQRLAYDDAPSSWGAMDEIKRSGEGIEGVYFFKKGSDKIVVKPENNVSRVMIGNEMTKAITGLEAPDMKVHKVENTDEKKDPITQLLLDGPIVGARSPEEVVNQIDGTRFYMVMNLVEGKSIQTLDDDEATEYLKSSASLMATGRLMVNDAFLGHDDRLVGKVNLGNFFFNAATQMISTIDNDSKIEQTDVSKSGTKLSPGAGIESAMHKLEMMMDKSQRKPMYIAPVLAKFKNAHREHGTAIQYLEDNYDAIVQSISDGMDQGFEGLKSMFESNKDLVKTLDDTVEEYGGGRYSDHSAAKELSHYVKDRLGGTSKEDATKKLVQYVKYRKARDAKAKGLKWWVKATSKTGY
jgi:hypothetical protein